MAAQEKSLGNRSAKAAGVGLVGTAAKLVLQLAAQLILLRLVSPNDYGLFAIAAICISLANFLANAGLSAALIQRDSIDDDDIVCAFSWQALLGSIITLIVFLAAPLIASFFSKPELIDALRILSFVCLFSAASSVSNALLVRNLQYFDIHRANLTSYVIGYGIFGIGLAYLGYGYFALIAAWLIQAILLAVFYYFSAPHRIGFSLRHQSAGALTAFGKKAIVTNLMNWCNNTIDKVVVGRFYGAADTGLYSVAYNLVFTPLMQLLSTLQSVAFSASSRITSEDDYRSVSLGTLFLATMFFLPAFAAVSIASKPLITILLGLKWAESSAILEILSLSFAFVSIQGMLTPFLWGKDEVEREMSIQIVIAILAAILMLLVVDLGLVAIAAVALIVSFARLILVLAGVKRAFSLSLATIFLAIVPGALTALAVVMVGYWLLSITIAAPGNAVAQVASISIAYVVIFGLSIWLHRKKTIAILSPLLGESLLSRRLKGLRG